jgi:pimeloyl-ACP methyl ester carboxylesterase
MGYAGMTMIVSQPSPIRTCSRPPTPPPPDRGWLGDVLEKARDVRDGLNLLVAGALFLHGKGKAEKAEQVRPPLSDQPDVKLNRPVMLVPGWNTEHWKFDFLANKLVASGLNGDAPVYLQLGKAYKDNECTLPLDQIPSNSKVFVNIWETPKDPPEKTAVQLKQNMDLVQSALGPAKVDLIGYSMGGLASRKYLDNGGEQVGKLVTLGTPHQGTRFGVMCDRLISHKVDWATKFGGLGPQDLPAMQWLAAGKPNLQALNQNWPQQRARLEDSLFIASKIEPTPRMGLLPFGDGDGLVQVEHATLPGASTKVLHGTPLLNHISLPHDSQVFGQMQAFLGWEARPGSPAQPFFTPTHPSGSKTPYGSI